MKIAQLHPSVTAWEDEQVLHAGQWHARDFANPTTHSMNRGIYHYKTLMVIFTSADDGKTWYMEPESLGHGSVSDQQGCNQLAKGQPWYFSRKGTAEWVRMER